MSAASRPDLRAAPHASVRARFGALLALTMGASGGCLVTEKIEYAEEDVAPVVRVVHPIGPVVPFPRPRECGTETAADAGPDAAPSGEWVRVVASVSDLNVDDVLIASVMLNGDRITGRRVKPNNGLVDRGDVEFCLKADLFSKACNLVQFLVVRVDDQDDDRPNGWDIDIYDPAVQDKFAIQSWSVLGLSNRSQGLCYFPEPDGGIP